MHDSGDSGGNGATGATGTVGVAGTAGPAVAAGVKVLDGVKLDGVKRRGRRGEDRHDSRRAQLRGLARQAAIKRCRTLVEQGATLSEAARVTGISIACVNRLSSAEGWKKERETLSGVVSARPGSIDVATAKEAYRGKSIRLGQRMLDGLDTWDLTDPARLLEAIPAFATLTRAMCGLLGIGQDSGGSMTVAGRNVVVLQAVESA